ncbi:MAG TPA: prepilin-type N-terminal cleavage/methylation domain-containing protein, partial [Thermoanaerobaculia bacterium]
RCGEAMPRRRDGMAVACQKQRRHGRRTPAQAGFSLAEVTVTLAVVSALMLIVYSIMDQTLRASMFNESHNDLIIMSQRAMNTMQTETAQARQVFQEDTDGAAYRSALQIPSTYLQWGSSLLPIVQTDDTMIPDTSTRYTGNAYFIVRQLEPLSFMYDNDNNSHTPDVEFLADRYRFEYFFLSTNTSRKFSSSPYTLDLMQSTSVEYADYFQLTNEGLTNSQMQTIASKLSAAGITTAWNPGQPLASAFYTIPANGNWSSSISRPAIDIASTISLFPELRGGRISGRMDYSVAFGTYPLPMRIAMYGTTINPPVGFEVKVAGPAKARKVMTRVLLMARYAVNTYEAQQGFVTTSASF